MGQNFDSFMDWMMDGPAPVAFLKMSAVVALLTGAIMSPFIYVGYQNGEELKKNFKILDQGPRVEFNSVASCVARHYAQADCARAQKEAIDIAGSLGTTASYNSAADCQMNHGACREETALIPITTYVNNMPLTTYVPSTTYHPDMLGWQATRDGLTHAVPLYRSAQADKLMRGDGKLFNAPQP